MPWVCSKCGGSGSLYEKTCPVCEIPTKKMRFEPVKNEGGLMCAICGGDISEPGIKMGGGVVVHIGCLRKGF